MAFLQRNMDQGHQQPLSMRKRLRRRRLRTRGGNGYKYGYYSYCRPTASASTTTSSTSSAPEATSDAWQVCRTCSALWRIFARELRLYFVLWGSSKLLPMELRFIAIDSEQLQVQCWFSQHRHRQVLNL
ncbi:unnamed protein product [Symbiodinium sp. CCMP2592]|nr:unnamed protein product [Symbiodinium sp. CCMP2592]